MTTTTEPATIVAGAITWFEIPALDIETSRQFYERALETHLKREDFGPTRLAMLPPSPIGQRGALCQGPGMAPRDHGAVVYLAVPDIGAAMARWTEAGGRALTPVIDLPAGIGRIAHMLDAEGGRVGLHEPGART